MDDGSSDRDERPAPTPAVVLDAVTKRYEGASGPPAVVDVSLTLERGTYTALMGPSGCGKTTLLNLVGCLDVPTEGRVVVGGRETSTASDAVRTAIRREAVGFVFQQFNLHPKLTALENVALPRSFSATPRAEARAEAAALLELVGLAAYADRRPNQLSGGQQQRVAVARALVGSPAVVLADEPTGNLDRATGDSLMALFDSLADAGHTLVVATHDPRVAQHADTVRYLEDGHLVEPDEEAWRIDPEPVGRPRAAIESR